MNALDKLRADGWSVAVHNDYRLRGEHFTFYLFTHPDGSWIKGEGRTDEEAVCQAMGDRYSSGIDEAHGDPAPGEPLFYIQDKRSVVGNCVLWWRANGQGYTTELNDAVLYSASKAGGLRESDVLVPKELAESLAVKHVRVEPLREAMAILAKGETLLLGLKKS